MIPTTLSTTPHAVTDDTWIVPTIAAEPGGTYVAAHSLVIRGAEPVLVDTGASLVRDEWAERAFSVVDPGDVRWIVLSHDDHDHIGNVLFALDECPDATLVASYSIVSRLAGDVELPLDRMAWRNPGDVLALPDRDLHFVRPPLFDSPSTRGVFDARTGVLWAVDAFGMSLPGEVYESEDVPAEMLDASFPLLNLWNTPWLEWVDPARFDAHLRETEALPITAIASAHGAVLRGDRIADGFRRTRELVGASVPAMPGQEMLELVLEVLATPA